MFSNQRPTTSGGLRLSNCSRKRRHESECKPKSGIEREKKHRTVLDARDIISLFSEPSEFDGRIEKINVKDMICQEFIDRIGKLYKPVLLEQNWNTNQINERLDNVSEPKKMFCEGEYLSVNKTFKEYYISKKLLVEYDINSHSEEDILKYCSEGLSLPFSNFEDIVMGLVIIHLGEAFTQNEILNRISCRYTMSNTTLDEDYDSHNCLEKRRKLMSSLSK